MTDAEKKWLEKIEWCISDSRKQFDYALKHVFVGATVETQVGRHIVRCKVIDAEEGKLVLDNGARREWRNVEPVVICDRQDEARRHEARTEEAVK